MATSEYPLKWPAGWKREGGKTESKFKTTLTKAHSELSGELQLMGASGIIISSDQPLLVSGKMRMDRNPADPGCAVYFTRKGVQTVFACDRYDDLKDNMRAIALTVGAMRGIERWGASSMMERAFAGFGLVPASVAPAPPEDWWDVLDVKRSADLDTVEAVYRTKAKKAHPDNGGTTEEMQRLTRARDTARQEKHSSSRS